MTEFHGLSLRWSRDELRVLDQTLLPTQESWQVVASVEEMIEAIRTLKVRGAPLIGVAAALVLGDEVRKRQPTRERFLDQLEALRASRPTAVNLMWALDRLREVAAVQGLEEVPHEAVRILEEDIQLCERIASHGAALIESGENILTHCNTGGLATSGVGTALGVVRRAHEQGKSVHVWVDETRPLLQGGRLTTYELEKLHIPYTLICDNMAGALMARGQVQRVIVGSDRIARNGDFANKIGTYGLAVLAHFHRIPMAVAAPWSTVDLSCASGCEIPIEERRPEEVTGASGAFGQVRWAPEGAQAWNPAFDVTPAHLVDHWILDRGVLTQTEVHEGALLKMKSTEEAR